MRRALIIGIVFCVTMVAAAGSAQAAPTAPTLLAPTDGLIAMTGTSIALVAQDADPTVTSVEFIDTSAANKVLATASIRGSQDTFSVPWPVTGGSHTIVARAQDGTDHTDSATSAIVKGDTNAPTATITSPTAAAIVRQPTSITGTTDDDTKVVKLEVFAGATLIGTINQPGATWSLQWSATQADGAVNLTAKATDAVGRPFTTGPVAVSLDNTAPAAFTVSALSPVDSNPALGWTPAADAHTVTYAVTRDGTAVGSTAGLSYSDTGAAAGSHSYGVTATDAAGNVRVGPSVTVRVDPSSATAPTGVTGASPTRGTPIVTWTPPSGIPISAWQVVRDGSSTPIPVPAGVTTFLDTATLADGPHLYQVRGLDLSGSPLVASKAITILLDRTPPKVPAPIAAPQADGSVQFTWPVVTDPEPSSGLTQVYLRRGSTEVCAGDASLSGCADATAPDGTSTYTLYGVDRAGNTANQSIDVTAHDSLPPSAPRGLSVRVKNQIATITWKAAAPQEGVASWKVIQLAARTTKPRSPADGTPVCPLVPVKLTICTSARPLVNGAAPVRFAVFAVDQANNASAAAVVLVKRGRSDLKPPIIVGGVHAQIGTSHTFVTLTWKKPPDPDLKEFVIRWLPTRYPVGVRVGFFAYRGHAISVKLGQRPGTTRFYAVYATDRSGNASPAARIKVVMPRGVPSKPRTPGSGPVIKIN